MSAFYGVKYLLPYIPKKAESSIIFISSIVVQKGSGSGGVAYVSSKSALIGLARQLALELKPIRVNVVAPGYIETDMIKHWNEERRKAVMEKIPLQRLGKPEDIADVVECLIEKMKYVNGEVIHVNGGLVFGG
jgi:3-oxoacyl-[acyl-carrier protein] reductase